MEISISGVSLEGLLWGGVGIIGLLAIWLLRRSWRNRSAPHARRRWILSAAVFVLAVLMVIDVLKMSRTSAPTNAVEIAAFAHALPGKSYWSVVNNEPQALSEMRGRWVLLNVWATWCAPCIAEFPALRRIADETDIEVVLVSNESPENLRKFLKKTAQLPSWWVAPDEADFSRVNVRPVFALMRPDGTVALEFSGTRSYEHLKRILEKAQAGESS